MLVTDMTPIEFLKLWEDTNGKGSDDYVCIQDGEWEVDGKYQTNETIFQNVHTAQYFAIYQSRVGSYHTDYDYNDPDCQEVEPRLLSKTIFTVK